MGTDAGGTRSASRGARTDDGGRGSAAAGTRARLAVVALAIALVATLVAAAAGSSVAFSPYSDEWDGTSGLLREAGAVGATAGTLVDTTEYDRLDPASTVVVVLSPARAYEGEDAARVRAFVEAGGTLLVAEDFGPHGNALLAATGATARVDGRPLRDERFHSRSPALPVARDVTPHATTAGVDAVTVNFGTALVPGDATVLIRTSPYAYLDGDRDEVLDDGEPLAAFPVVAVESVGEGRIVVASDPSLFINAMLVRPGNRDLARALFSGTDAGTVVVDASHAERVPPLPLARYALATDPVLQLGVVIAGALLVGVWTVGPSIAARLDARRRADARLDAATARARLVEQHPDWDDDRVDAVVESFLRRRGDGDA